MTHVLLPLNLDNDLYQAMGWELAAHGRLPLIGSWAHTLPGMGYLHAFSILLCGNTAFGFRLFDCFAHLATAGLLFVALRRRIPERTASIAVVLWTLYYISEGYWLAGQVDGFALFFFALGLDQYDRAIARDHRTPALIAGLCMAAMTMLRPTYGLFGLVFAGCLLYLTRGKDDLKGHAPLLWYLLGGASGVLLACLPYVFVTGGLYQLYEASIGFNLTSYGNVRADYNWLQLLRHPLVLLAFTALIPGRARTCDRISVLQWVSFVLCSLASLVVMGKYLVYHFDPLFLLLAIAAAVGLEKACQYVPWRAIRYALQALVLLYVLRIFYPFNLLHYYREALQQRSASVLDYVQHAVKSDSLYGLPAEDQLLAYVTHTYPRSERIEYCSITPAIRWRSGREESSRFTMIHAYGLHTASQDFTPFQRACRAEFLDSLRSNQPAAIILATGPANLPMFDFQPPAQIVKAIPGVTDLLNTDYVYDTTLGVNEVWRRVASRRVNTGR